MQKKKQTSTPDNTEIQNNQLTMVVEERVDRYCGNCQEGLNLFGMKTHRSFPLDVRWVKSYPNEYPDDVRYIALCGDCTAVALKEGVTVLNEKETPWTGVDTVFLREEVARILEGIDTTKH